MNFLLLPQNDTHAKNFALLERDLLKCGHNVSVLCIDSLTGQNTLRYFSGQQVEQIDVQSDKPFYLLNGFQRLGVLRSVRQAVGKLSGAFDFLIVGNDGAIQRIVASSLIVRTAKIYLVLDGNLTNVTGWRRRFLLSVRKIIFSVATSLNLGAFAPSVVGHSCLDHIFVMNAFVKDVLVRQGVDRARISVVVLPRHEEYSRSRELSGLEEKLDGASRRFLYATTAFRWHGEHELADLQRIEINELVETFRRSSGIQLRIRLHPRESRADYPSQFPSGVELVPATSPLLKDLEWTDIVLLSRSSVAFEADLVGKQCVISSQHIPLPGPTDYLTNAEHISVVAGFAQFIEDCIQNRFNKVMVQNLPRTETPPLLFSALSKIGGFKAHE